MMNRFQDSIFGRARVAKNRVDSLRTSTFALLCRAIGPVTKENVSLLHNTLGGAGLFVGRVAVAAKNAFDQHSHLGADVFAVGPVDGDAVSHGAKEFLSDYSPRLIAERRRQ
jgi:hypothetical protein